MRLLVIDDNAKKEIKRVIDYAESHRFHVDTMKVLAIAASKNKANLSIGVDQSPDSSIGNDQNFVCEFSDGFRVVYSIEQQLDGEWYRHLSVSVNSETNLPSMPAVEMIMKEFGFCDKVIECDNVWVESKINPMAVNLLLKYIQKDKV
jgi:hypothetical protein